MSYKYDVFLSYNCKFPQGNWVNDIFYPFFKPFLEDALNVREVRIFKDTVEITSGQAWEARIKDALIHSRIMVSIVSPAYFLSEWCKKEFAFMDFRQRACNFMTVKNPNGLIVPLKISDGDNFSDYVKAFQIEHFNDYFRIGPGFEKTIRHVDMQEKLLDWVNEVANAHRNAPEWNDEWLHPDWFSNAWQNLDELNSSIPKTPPTL